MSGADELTGAEQQHVDWLTGLPTVKQREPDAAKRREWARAQVLADRVRAVARQPRKRGPGRDHWTERLFDKRWREAVKAAGGNTDIRAVAKRFRGLNRDANGVWLESIEPDTLARLRSRRKRGRLPTQ